MDIYVYNSSFVAQSILDANIESFYWVERYNDVGEFEIYAKYKKSLWDVLKQDYILRINSSDRAMIIETVVIKSDPVDGDKIVVKGRTAESFLDRRIVLSQVLLDDTLQNCILSLINNNMVSSIYPERNFPSFAYVASSHPSVTAPLLKAQFFGDNILEVVRFLCKQNNLGFKVTVAGTDVWSFQLYVGSDRSFSQSTLPFVVFSPTFDNLIESDYLQSTVGYKNYALVVGDQTSGYPKNVQCWTPEAVLGGFKRREMFVDASDLPSLIDGTSTPISTTDYQNQLTQRGNQELAVSTKISAFEGKASLANSYKYGTDFIVGDIIQLEDAYGNKSRVRVTEMTFSDNLSGSSAYPTLETV